MMTILSASESSSLRPTTFLTRFAASDRSDPTFSSSSISSIRLVIYQFLSFKLIKAVYLFQEMIFQRNIQRGTVWISYNTDLNSFRKIIFIYFYLDEREVEFSDKILNPGFWSVKELVFTSHRSWSVDDEENVEWFLEAPDLFTTN